MAEDRTYVSQFSQYTLGISIYVASVLTDADGNDVTVTVNNEDTQATVFTRSATHAGTGLYEVTLTPDDTSTLGNYSALWSYQIAGDQKTFYAYYSIGGGEPAYDSLAPALKQIVDYVWIRLSDMFDSPNGGPNLSTYFQTNWNRGRVAQMLGMAVRRLNTVAQPTSNYAIDGTGPAFPTANFAGLLEQATYVEALKHLRRSYLEQPDYQGSSVSRLDRRDYFDRWAAVLADEEALLRPQLDVWKISQMGLGRPAILVSGGIYGRYAPVNYPGLAGRPRTIFANYW